MKVIHKGVLSLKEGDKAGYSKLVINGLDNHLRNEVGQQLERITVKDVVPEDPDILKSMAAKLNATLQGDALVEAARLGLDVANLEADATRAKGDADAFVIKAKGDAEAAVLRAKVEALGGEKNGGAEKLANIEKVRAYGGQVQTVVSSDSMGVMLNTENKQGEKNG